ncbi:MAG: AAA family ATPase, partial [Clostridia bacterium]
MAQRLFYYTNGYPFLVSLLCKTMDEERLNWTDNSVDEAEKHVLKTNNTLFDDVIKNLVNHPSFGLLVESILLRGEEVPFEVSDPDIDWGLMFGILRNDNGKTCVSNTIFETRILNYYVSTSQARSRISLYIADHRSRFLTENKLNMPLVLERFAAFMRCEYR